VLSTLEIEQLIKEQNVDFLSLSEAPLTGLFMNVDDAGQPCGMLGGTSGGHLEFVYRYASKELWNMEVDNVQYKQGRNTDFSEVTLEGDGKTLLRFARAYGFRNIQNVVRRLKLQNRCEYDFIEIMACPGGCTNGGGQIRPNSNQVQETKKLLQRVNEIYNQMKLRCPGNNQAAISIYKDLSSDSKTNSLHTSYRAVPKLDMTNPLAIKW